MSSFDTHFEALPEALQLHALDQQLPYIATKAARYLEVGPEEYRNTDAFGQPATTDAEDWPPSNADARNSSNAGGSTPKRP